MSLHQNKAVTDNYDVPHFGRNFGLQLNVEETKHIYGGAHPYSH